MAIVHLTNLKLGIYGSLKVDIVDHAASVDKHIKTNHP